MNSISKKVFSMLCAALCTVTSAPAPTLASADVSLKYEAENAQLSGVQTGSGSSYSGGRYVIFQNSGSCTFTVSVPENGFYDLNFRSSGIGSDKYNYVSVDGEGIGEFYSRKGTLGDGFINRVYLTKGSRSIKVTPSWGYINLDCLIITGSETSNRDYYDVSKALINPSASDSAKRLMSFIADNYGKNVISGQTCDDGLNGNEFKAIKNLTGKTPAILGMDLMRYTPTRVSKGDSCKTVENAVEFTNAGGIVELCWHWNAPDKYLKSGTDSSGNPRWWGGFYTDNLNIDFSRIMDGSDPEGYDLLMKDIDAIAVQLKKLKDADVPVLFRPLHEASGGWFWWGSDGAAPYIKLWKTMYDKLTGEYGLDNLIWVWNGQDKSWYPGDGYVDIIGEDIYPGNHVYNPQSSKFLEAAEYTDTNKVVALTENGCLFDIDKALSSGTVWSWFCVWGGDFCSNGTSISEKYTESYMWNKVYNHTNVITLDEMPDLKTYPVNGSGHTHSYTSKVTKAASCTGKGERTYTCACGEKYTEAIPALGHSCKTTVTAPTYAAQGYTLHKCTRCSYSYKTNYTGKKTVPTVSVKSAYTSVTDAVRVNWTKVKGASGYRIYRYNTSTKKWVNIKTIENGAAETYRDAGLKSGTQYKYKVKAYVRYNGTVYWGSASREILTATKPEKVTIGKINISTTSVRLFWNKVSCTGYKVQQSSDGGKTWKTVKLVKGAEELKIRGLKRNTSYKYRVLAYKSNGGGTNSLGAWSGVKTVRTKK